MLTMRIESFKRSRSEITSYFENSDVKAYTTNDLMDVFNSLRDTWRIAGYRNYQDFIKILVEWEVLLLKRMHRNSTGEIKSMLYRPGASNFDISQAIIKSGYLSNYSAMAIHQLTEQIPKSFYLSYGKSEGYIEGPSSLKNISKLNQVAVDKAFSKIQRVTSDVYTARTDNSKFFLIQKKYSDELIGVTFQNSLRYTDLERTLIDIVVRPAYSGGVFEVLKAFENARDRLDTKLLSIYLRRLNYIYPYHQSIGFFLERAGYNKNDYAYFINEEINIKFYITYNISNLEYDDKWKVYYPRGF